MAPLTYAAPSYSLGDNASPVTKAKASESIKGMQKSLKRWLGYRNAMNAAAGKMPAEAVAKLRRDRLATEQALANHLHGLLTECGASGSAIPTADVSADPDAAAKLAEIAILGKAPDGSTMPQATGFFWLLAIPVAGVVLIVSQWIKGKADLAMEQERRRCIESGACTDEGFWLKWGAIAVLGWLAWDKFGIREAVRRKRA